MTDDLFEDFDLKPAAQSKKEDEANTVPQNLTDEQNLTETQNTAELSSEDLHPDIFAESVAEPSVENDGEMTDDEIRNLAAQIEEENKFSPNNFSFDNIEKEPFENVQTTPSEMMADNVVVEVRRIDKIRRPDVQIDPENYGATLRKLREAACISLGELSEELRIKESFLAALEHEDYDNLPPEVFIIAYIRRLGGIYHLSNDEINLLTAKVKDRMEVDLPDDMDKVVIFNEPSEENEHKIRYIFTAFIIILLIVVISVAAGIYFFVSGNRRDSGTETPSIPRKSQIEQFSSETLIKLQPQVKLDSPPLKITK